MTNPVAFGFNTPFFDQLEFFKAKLNLPSERWDDIKKSAHDRAFIVAGAMKADLLKDLNGAITKAIEQGTGYDQFHRDFMAIVKKHGWTGWTGEGTKAGQAWRSKVVYQTNMATAYAAGRYKQLTDPDFLTLRPYWRYKHADWVANPRHNHLAWNNLTLPYDHPFWKLHFPPQIPPNWHCHCRVTPVDAREYAKSQAAGKSEPPVGFEKIDAEWKGDERIAAGWNFAPGANTYRPLKDFIDEKLIKLDAPIGAAMYEAMRPVLVEEMRQAVIDLVATATTAQRATGLAALAHVVSPRTVADLADRGVPMESADVWLRDEELLHALRLTKSDRGAALPLSVWRELPAVLDGATPYLDTHDAALVYAFDMPDGVGKVLVRVNYADKLRIQGKRTRVTSNFVRTGGLVEARNINAGTQYVELEK